MVLLLGFAIMLFTFSTNISLGQLLPFGLENTATNIKAVNITSPINHQQVPIGKDLMISGTSIANATSNCQIIVGINNIKPYPRAIGIGPGGAKDYSKWSLTLASNYSAIKQGPDNKITARYKCSSSNNINPTIIPVNSINVTGVPVTNTNNTIINQSPQQQRPSSTPENNITTTTSSTPTIIPGLLH
jgi:hypothetical protein